jgi:hypothetical protein
MVMVIGGRSPATGGQKMHGEIDDIFKKWRGKMHSVQQSEHLYYRNLKLIDSFLNTPTAGRGVQLDLYPKIYIQAQRTVRASKSHEISNHITRHSAVNIGRIRSIELTNRSTIFRWVRWLMGLMVYSDEGFRTAIGTTPCKS